MNITVCITGMHRSGTSLTTSWLQNCGLQVHDGSYWGPGPGNPKGHFEDRDFVALHESVLNAYSPASLGWKITKKSNFFFNNPLLINQALQLVNVRNSKYYQWGWKDPRTSLFLLQWKKLIPSLKTVVLWRPCGQVVRSLITRASKSKDPVRKVRKIESILIWTAYNTLLIEYKRLYPLDALFYPLQRIISNDQDVLNAINEKLMTNLIYHPFSDIYDSGLLNQDRVSSLIRIFCLCLGSHRINRKLEAISDC